MGVFSVDSEVLGKAASAFGQARDQSDSTIAYLKNATLVASALGTTGAGAQFVAGVMNARERQFGVQKSAQDVHESARVRLESARKMAEQLVVDTSAVAGTTQFW
ncbi:hypothetical protein CLV47_13418 [Antricoccus suffuscus]|uniref:Uncharacterized protein n=1 Tax=Antricoccus suffuscus TaxID=1629062 RepID=A0A2T0YZE7_9ACTN|nr:hypothetical protein [Antricoccus suffuscus]PRZ29278.1 hypothetical protein CLV47_13418 [Antricoccus suffuscus]